MTPTWTDAYHRLLDTALSGEERNSREGLTRDAGPVTVKLGRVPFILMAGRGGSIQFAETEQLCYLAGIPSWPLLQHAPSYRRFAIEKVNAGPDEWTWPGSYGPRLFTGLIKAVELLHRDPDTRQAVIPIYNTDDLERAGGGAAGVDIPCTLALNFWRDPVDKVNCHAIMRSSDAWFGTYYDLPAFHFLQCRVAEALKICVANLWFTTSSLHIYQKHWGKAAECVSWPFRDSDTWQKLRPESAFLTGPTVMESAHPVDRMVAMQQHALAFLSPQEVTSPR